MDYDIKLKSYLMVRQANQLIRAKQDSLTLAQFRLLRIAIAQIVRSDNEFYTYTANLTELARFCGIPRSDLYGDIKNIGLNLLTKRIYIEDGKKDRNGRPHYKGFQWVSSVEYAEGTLRIRLNDELRPFLLDLNGYFTTYPINQMLKLPTEAAGRLFELLYSFVGRKFQPGNDYKEYYGIEIAKDECILSIAELRRFFDCEDKYPNTSDFIKRVIDANANAINTHTVFPVSYRTVRQGRAIRFVIFKLDDWAGKNSAAVLERLKADTDQYRLAEFSDE